MTDVLAKTLVLNNAVAGPMVEEALQRQVVHGGSLDTNLLELDAIDEATLLYQMSEAYGLPAAEPGEIDTVGAHIPRLFPQLFAETYHLVPFRLVGQNLGVLVNRPAEPALFARITERLSLAVKPAVTTEVRLHYAMYRLYGVALQPRYRDLLARLGHAALPADPTLPPSTKVLSWGLGGTTLASGERPPLTVSDLLGRLASATDRDAIIDVLLEAALSTFEFAAIFLVHGEQINGWRGMDPETSQRVVRISLPVELPSVFQTIYATHGHYLGPLPANSINTRLLEELGRAPPRAALLAPLLVGGRLAGILLADNGPRGVPSKRVAAILLLTHRAGMCLEELIRRRKARAVSLVRDDAPVVEDTPTELGDADFEPISEAPVVRAPPPPAPTAAPMPPPADEPRPPPPLPPPLPPRPTVAPAPATEPMSAAPESAEEPVETGLWQSVQLESLDTTAVTGQFDHDASPAAATAAFAESAQASAVDESAPVELGFEPPTEEDLAPARPYVAFAEVDAETPEQTIGGWEDVFVETVGSDRAVLTDEEPVPPVSAPPTVTWEDVIAEAEAAPALTSAPSAAVEIAGQVVDEQAMLLDSLDATDPSIWRGAIERLLPLGTAIDAELERRFPGQLSFDPFVPATRLPPFSHCSGITALLAARGAGAAPVVLPFLESNDPVKRLFAIYYLYAVPYAAALELLARRLYDAEPRNRFLAADALRTYRHEPGYRRIIQGLRDHLKVPIFEAQVATVQVLGQLRDPSAVPSLIPLVISPRPALARASASALTVICGQAFGSEVARWADWWQSHFNKPREAWLVEGMRHADANVRRIAAREFQLLTGHAAPFESGVTPEQPAAAP